MKTKIRILVMCCCFGFSCKKLKSQVGYGFDTPLKGYCQPGVNYKSNSRGLDFAYQATNGGQLSGLSEGLNSYQSNKIESFTLKIKAPLVLKPDFKLLVGYSHLPEANRLGTTMGDAMPLLTSLDGQFLKSQGLGLYAIKSFNATNYLAVRLKVNASGDFDGFLNFDRQFVSYSAIAAFGIKKSGDLEYGVGLTFNRNARRTAVLPFFIYNKNFNDRWGIEANIPAKMNLRHNLNRETIILVGTELNSRNYGVNISNNPNNIDETNPFLLNQLAVQAGFSVERHVISWLWFNLKGGYQFNFSTRLFSLDGSDQLLKYKPDNAMYFRMGFFLSPN